MVQLSVVIITYNEEINIERCIDSVSSIADEILVVDSFSTDKTKEMCEAKGVRFLTNVFEGYIEQKHFATSQATHDYVLSIDADECLSEELEASIRDVKNNWMFDGYKFNRLNNYCGKWIRHCGWYPDKKLRLLDRTKGNWQGINPHDEYIIENRNVGYLKGNLFHYPFDTIDQHKKQIDFFSDVSAKALFDQGKKSNFILPIVKAAAKFIQSYFLKLGFLDGYYGLLICSLSSGAKYKKYKKLRLLNKRS
ncbi:MAG: glycosyltransferase family 2 protein [Bacteroidetes bacterium]|nr:glycosyltransferase family 2 protein [Bacteroidota bacterium]